MPTVDLLTIADAATIEGGKLNLLGAGWDVILVRAFPVMHRTIAVAFRTKFGWNDTNESVRVGVELLDEDGHPVAAPDGQKLEGAITTGRPAQLKPGEDQAVPGVVIYDYLTFNRAGTYTIVVNLNGMEAARTTFRVVAA